MIAHFKFLLRKQAALLRRARLRIQFEGLKDTIYRHRAVSHSDKLETGKPGEPVTTSWSPEQSWVLVVDATLPKPDRDSGSMRLVNLLSILVEAGHRVVFIPDDGRCNSRYASNLHHMGVYVPDLRTPTAQASWLVRNSRQLKAAILCRHYVARHWLELVRTSAPDAKIVFDTVDLHFLRESREAVLRNNSRLLRLAEQTRKLEIALISAADMTWVVSSTEQEILRELAPDAYVQILSNIVEVNTAGPPFRDRRDLVFVGGMSHPPNRDALQWLTRDIFPLIQRELPTVKLHIVGQTTDEVRSMLQNRNGVIVHGHVLDIASFMLQCRIGLAPLRFGAGVKGKINLSMAYGQPVVATTCGIEGMHLRHNYGVLVADDASAFASEVVRLYNDEVLWHRLSEEGRENVRRYFSRDIAKNAVNSIFEKRGE